MPQTDSILQAVGISKSFGEIHANDGVDLDVKRGSIHALLGENGAGKTTLMNQLYGLYKPDAGKIYLDGREVSFNSPLDAIRNRIYMITQNLSLIPRFTVAENIFALYRALGRNTSRAGVEKEVNELAKVTGLNIDLDAVVKDLPMGVRQRVEIMRALMTRARLFLLDEPTSILTPQESLKLFEFLKRLKGEGVSVLVATHNLEEAVSHCDYVTVLRHGKVVAQKSVSATNVVELAREMIGQHYGPSQLDAAGAEQATRAKEVLRLQNIVFIGKKATSPAVNGVSLTVNRSEIFGIAGVAGNGQSELGLIAAGILPPSRGNVYLYGEALWPNGRAKSTARIAFVPEDGQESGIIPNMSVKENLILKSYEDFRSHWGLINMNAVDEFAKQLVKKFDIRPGDINMPAKLLSGGNLQRLILARELSGKADVLVAMNPTKGLDVRSRSFVHGVISEFRSQGHAVLLISQDLDELLNLADRVAVMYRGTLVSEWKRDQVNLEQLGLAMGGSKSWEGQSSL